MWVLTSSLLFVDSEGGNGIAPYTNQTTTQVTTGVYLPHEAHTHRPTPKQKRQLSNGHSFTEKRRGACSPESNYLLYSELLLDVELYSLHSSSSSLLENSKSASKRFLLRLAVSA